MREVESQLTADVVTEELSPDGAMKKRRGVAVSFIININQVRID